MSLLLSELEQITNLAFESLLVAHRTGSLHPNWPSNPPPFLMVNFMFGLWKNYVLQLLASNERCFSDQIINKSKSLLVAQVPRDSEGEDGDIFETEW